MKRLIIIILTISLFSLTSCVSMVLKHIGVFDEEPTLTTLKSDDKTIIFIDMHHVGKKAFYDNVGKKIDSLTQLGFMIFYENAVPKNKDFQSQDTINRKMRKLVGFDISQPYYDTINKKFMGMLKYNGKEKLMNQPKELKTFSNYKNAVNVDIPMDILLKKFEAKHSKIELTQCDFKTDFKQEYQCEKMDKKIEKAFNKDFIILERNMFLAKSILDSKSNNIVVVYGKMHLNGLFDILKQSNPNWYIVKAK